MRLKYRQKIRKSILIDKNERIKWLWDLMLTINEKIAEAGDEKYTGIDVSISVNNRRTQTEYAKTKSLPIDLKQAAKRYFLDGRLLKEIAVEMGLNYHTLYNRVKRNKDEWTRHQIHYLQEYLEIKEQGGK